MRVWLFFIIALLASCHSAKPRHGTGNISIISAPDTSSFFQFLSPFRDSIVSQMSQTVGWTDSALHNGKPWSTLGNWCADACLRFALNHLPHNPSLSPIDTAAFCCVLNAGGLRTSLPAGSLTVGHFYELMPFDNELVLLQISSPSAIDSLLKHVALRGEPIAGFQIHTSNNLVQAQLINGKPLPSSLNLITSDYLATGGDGFSMLKSIPRVYLGSLLRNALIWSAQTETQQFHHLFIVNHARISVE